MDMYNNSPAGVVDFRNWTWRAKNMTVAALRWSAKDCAEAAEAMSGHAPIAEGRYMDECSVYRAELARR